MDTEESTTEIQIPSDKVSDKEQIESLETSEARDESDIKFNSIVDMDNDKIVTIVAEEKEGQIFIYDRNENGVDQDENTGELIEVCDSKTSIEVDNGSQENISEGVPFNDNKDSENPEQNAENKVVDVDDGNSKDNIVEVIKEDSVTSNLNDDSTGNTDENQCKNYKSVILEDWEVEVPHVNENHDGEFTETVITTEPQITEVVESEEVISNNMENCTVVQVVDAVVVNESDIIHENSKVQEQEDNSGSTLEGEILKLMADTKADTLKYSKSISKNDIVKILDESSERLVKPIVTGKDLFFSIELTKRLNQKILQNKLLKNSGSEDKANESESCNNNNTVDDRQKIVEILEADEIKDWKSIPSKSDTDPKENGNDMEISKAIKSMEESNAVKKPPAKPQKKTSGRKFKTMDKELERSIALQQLREEFPTTRKRTRTMKKVNHIPFLASTVLEKAMTSPEVTTALKPGPPKRRPCYLPENKADVKTAENEDVGKNKKLKVVNNADVSSSNSVTAKTDSPTKVLELPLDDTENPSIANSIVKTYSAKRKSTDTENEIKSTLETIAAVRKALCESSDDTSEIKPKKQKTVTKSTDENKKKVLVKKKTVPKVGAGKRNSELEKLLGDEGAVRMLYDAQHKASSSSPKKSKTKTTVGLKKDLVLKTKLVKNAVMRLSGVGTEGVYLRKKRFSKTSETPEINAEPLFASSPNIVLYKPKKKQRAEASRILYRHSSSESFDSSDSFKRESFSGDTSVNAANKEVSLTNVEKVEENNSTFGESEKVVAKVKKIKTDIFTGKKLKKIRGSPKVSTPQKKEVVKVVKPREKIENASSDSVVGSKLNLSNVPVRKSSRPRMVSKKYSIWSSTSMDSLSAESLGLKKLKKASSELGKKLNCKELTILQYESLVQVILNPVSTLLKNSLNLEVLNELKQVFSFLSEEDSCKAVLLSSTGTTFCQGIDLNKLISCAEEERKSEASQLAKGVGEICACLANFKKPLVAGVQGTAVGLGVTLLSYCDIVVASDNASFFTPYIKLGQAPEGAATYTFPRISRHLVSELLFQCHKMTVADAYKHGLVSRIIAEERFDEELLVLARNMAAQPVQGVQSTKLLLRNCEVDGILETLQTEAEFLEEHWTSQECLNNMIKFLNSGELQLKQLDNT